MTSKVCQQSDVKHIITRGLVVFSSQQNHLALGNLGVLQTGVNDYLLNYT